METIRQLAQGGQGIAYLVNDTDQLGHHSIQITVDIYGRLVPGRNRQAVDKLDDAPKCNPYLTTTAYDLPNN